MTTIIGLVVLGVVALFLARALLIGLAYIAGVIPQSIAVGAALLLGAVLVVRLLLAFVS